MKMFVLLAAAAAGLLWGCAGAGKKPATAAFDAASYLPTYPPLPAKAATTPASPPPVEALRRAPVAQVQNQRVETWLDTVAARNGKIRLARGYRVQVYVGQDRATAMATKETLYRHYPGTEVYMAYDAPSFRITCGDYLSRLEAQLAARRLTRHFANPLLVQGQVRILRPGL